jgi:hypothetical protein
MSRYCYIIVPHNIDDLHINYSTATKTYVKGFKIDRERIAKLAHVADDHDPMVDMFIHIIIKDLKRSGYKYIGAVHDHPLPPQYENTDENLAVVIILDEGHNKTELQERELGPIDDTIQIAQQHVLIGPDVWELWG